VETGFPAGQAWSPAKDAANWLLSWLTAAAGVVAVIIVRSWR